MTVADNSNVPPPPPRRRGIISEIPKPSQAPDNMSRPNVGLADMSFRMGVDFHRAFKMIATKRNMSMKDFLEASVRCWVDVHGDDDDKRWMPPK